MAPNRVLFILTIMVLQSGCMTCFPFVGQMGCPTSEPSVCSTYITAGCGSKCHSWFDHHKSKVTCGLQNIKTKLKCGDLLGIFSRSWGYQPQWYPSIRGYLPLADELAVTEAANELSKKSIRDLGQGYSRDFKDGFCRAYIDIAKGGTGETPPVPPEKYWKAHFRTAKGHEKAQQWFAGYRLGAQWAQADGIPDFNTIPTTTYSGYSVSNETANLQPNPYPSQSDSSSDNQQMNAVGPSMGGMGNGGAATYVGQGRYEWPHSTPLPTHTYR